MIVARGEVHATSAQREAIDTGVQRGTLIALIDDDALVREAMCGLLSSWGCEVVAVASAAEAGLELAGFRRAPDLIISDYRLAGGDTGLQAIAQLRRAFAADIPAFLITGDTSADVTGAIESAGMHALTKPVAPLRLRALVRQLLKTRSTQGGLNLLSSPGAPRQ